MNHDPSSITRELLYELVWATPLVKVAKTLGISMRGLRALCKQKLVPLPKPKEVSQIALGRAVGREALPDLPTKQKTVGGSGVLKKYKKTLSLCVENRVGEKAYPIISALEKAMNRRKFSLHIAWDKTQVLPSDVRLELYETHQYKRLNLVAKLEWFFLHLDRNNMTTRWKDYHTLDLQDHIDDIATSLAQVHKIMENRKAEEQGSAIVERNKKLMERLETQVECWRRANDIRAYLKAIDAAVKSGELQPDNDYKLWKSACARLAHQLDPITGQWSELPAEFSKQRFSSQLVNKNGPWWPVDRAKL